MKVKNHGFHIGMEQVGEHLFFKIKAVGKLTHEDYEIMNPMIDSALAGVTHPKVDVLFDGMEWEGWEPRAAWDDFKLGLKHGNKFEKIAIYGNKKWQEFAAKVGSWFTSGEVKFFDNNEDALAWLKEEKAKQ